MELEIFLEQVSKVTEGELEKLNYPMTNSPYKMNIERRHTSEGGWGASSEVEKDGESLPLPFKAALFDLDGVLTSTSDQHFASWKRIFETEAGVADFTRQDYNLYVSGKPRFDGIRSLLKVKGFSTDEERLRELARLKNECYLALLQETPPQAFEPAINLARELRSRGTKLAVASSSKNTPLILDLTGIRDLFEVVVAEQTVLAHGTDKTVPLHGKPAPDIFLQACEELGVLPEEAIGFEDAPSGIQAFQAAGIVAIAVDREGLGSKLQKAGAAVVVKELDETSPDELGEIFTNERLRHSYMSLSRESDLRIFDDSRMSLP